MYIFHFIFASVMAADDVCLECSLGAIIFLIPSFEKWIIFMIHLFIVLIAFG